MKKRFFSKFRFYRTYAAVIAFALLLAMVLNSSGCVLRINATDLMENVPPSADINAPTALSEGFVVSATDFSLELFDKVYASEAFGDDGNILLSPISVLFTLAMLANGADGETLKQTEAALCGFPTDELNGYLYLFKNSLVSEKKQRLDIANSIWFRNSDTPVGFTVKPEFLQKNADFYGADAYMSPFDAQTIKDMNRWVDFHTDGMIKNPVSELDPLDMIYLMNTVLFDAKWEEPYEKRDVYSGIFTGEDGSERSAEFMRSTETEYISDENSEGFCKSYFGGNYSFVAILPNVGTSVGEYLSTLDGEGLIGMLTGREKLSVIAGLPKFSCDYKVKLNDALQSLGMVDAFSAQADFSRLASVNDGYLFLSEVTHNTYIEVDENGTKAAALTIAVVSGTSAEPHSIILDRPFIYMIVDNETNIPIFIGAVRQ